MASSTENPWLERRVLAYAHQGGAKEGPSSTLHAIRSALAAGATAIELDVHVTADRKLVVCHDPTLDRTTDGSGAIADFTLEALGKLDNAHHFVPGEDAVPGRADADYPLRGRAPEDRSLCVASLHEVLDELEGVPVNLDIKQIAPQVEPYEELLASVLREHGRSDDVIVASFFDSATAEFRRHAPGVGTSAGTLAVAAMVRALIAGERVQPEPLACHVALQVPPSYEGIVIVDERFVEVAHGLGLAVHVWTIDEPDEMERLAGLGVDGIMTDRPSVLAGVLGRLGLAWRG
jgi:glycerophosphoryl diester phosphodiesterase